MVMSGAELVIRALEDEGIRLTFGIPGTHNIELYDALLESDRVRPILVTDEQSASFMADAAWRASGVMACVNVVPGAGLTHALSGIAEAFMDAVPMLVLGCGIRTDSSMAYQLHDIDQRAVVGPVTKGTFSPERGEDIYPTIRRACTLARAGRPGPVFVEIPANLYLFRYGKAEGRGQKAEVEASVPEHLLESAAALLAKARRPLLYVGLGAAGADLVALAERLEAPVATTFQGKGVFPETHPLALWPGYGASAPPFVRKIASGCDITLAIGCRFGEVATGSYSAPPRGPLIHVDIDPAAVGRNYPAAVGIAAGAREIVPALLARLPARAVDEELRAAIRGGREDVAREIAEPARKGVSPGRLLRALQERFGPETIFTSDSGNGTFLAVEALVLDKPGKLLAPVDYSCMGYAVPAAIGAKLAAPDAPVVALAGDGAFLMTGLELLTAAALRLPLMVFVLRDGELAQIAQFQSVAFGRKSQSELPDFDLASICRGVGVECLTLAGDDAIGDVVERAAAISGDGRPVVVEVAIDYSRKTFFTRGVVRTTLGRLPWPDRLRFIGRAVARKIGVS
jgi:acetolactate synthase-1/2/3 large subunit